jgi:chaperone LolA
VKKKYIRLFMLVSALFIARDGSAITGSEIIEKVQEHLDKSKTFSAEFEKQFYWAALDKSRSREGQIQMRRPGHFRIALDNGDAVVANGKTVWSYVERNNQVVISAYEGELRTPWQIFAGYAEDYVPIAVEEVKLNGRSCYMLVLKAASEVSSNRQMKVWVDKSKWWLLQVETVEDNDDITTYVLKGHKVNKKIDDSVFEFSIPQGAELIDRRVPVLGDE